MKDISHNLSHVIAAIYARVSSEKQAKAGTINSQVESILNRVKEDGLTVEPELYFIDDGYSGSTLIRPALERLRDQAAAGSFNRLYVYNPFRLSRNYAYQVLLIDELKRSGVEIIFLNHKFSDNPEEKLLLQVQCNLKLSNHPRFKHYSLPNSGHKRLFKKLRSPNGH